MSYEIDCPVCDTVTSIAVTDDRGSSIPKRRPFCPHCGSNKAFLVVDKDKLDPVSEFVIEDSEPEPVVEKQKMVFKSKGKKKSKKKVG